MRTTYENEIPGLPEIRGPWTGTRPDGAPPLDFRGGLARLAEAVAGCHVRERQPRRPTHPTGLPAGRRYGRRGRSRGPGTQEHQYERHGGSHSNRHHRLGRGDLRPDPSVGRRGASAQSRAVHEGRNPGTPGIHGAALHLPGLDELPDGQESGPPRGVRLHGAGPGNTLDPVRERAARPVEDDLASAQRRRASGRLHGRSRFLSAGADQRGAAVRIRRPRVRGAGPTRRASIRRRSCPRSAPTSVRT